MVIRCSVAVLAIVLGLSAAQSIAADEALANAAGEITLDGEPLAAGKITFLLDDDQFVGSKIKDGAYKVRRVPVGVWRVLIEGEGVPGTFSSEKTGAFTVRVSPDRNTFDFDLKRKKSP